MRSPLSVLLLTLLVLLSGGTISASGGEVRLGIEAVDSERSYFDLSLNPGESAELTVRLANHGESPTDATVFPADVYTLIGGGMGMREVDDSRTDPTTWLSFQAEMMDLEPGEAVERTFTVQVPEDAQPGDYITSVVIQNTDPQAIGTGDSPFSQTVRQGIAVAIDVPGERTPALEIGSVEHSVSGERSVILVEVENAGNVHLRPRGEFTLLDAEGDLVASSTPSLDTVYAGTSTILEVPFTGQLQPQEYAVSIALRDEETGAETSIDRAPLVLEAPDALQDGESDDAAAAGAAGALDIVDSTSSNLSILIAGTLATFGLLALLAAVLIGYSSRRRAFKPASPVNRSFASDRPSPSVAAPPAGPVRRRSGTSIRQLIPPNRSE